MSHENTSFVLPNPENVSNVDYKEYINSVNRNDHIDGFVQDPVETTRILQRNAEDEVVAILLSAMMGSIVEKWDCTCRTPSCKESVLDESIKDITKPSEMFSFPRASVTRGHSSVVTEGSLTSLSKLLRRGSSRKTLETRRTAMSEDPAITMIIESVQNPAEYLDNNSQKHGSIQTYSGTVRIEIDDKENDNSPRSLNKLKELLVNDKEKIYGWEFLDIDKEFFIKFKQGNTYEGKLLNCRMHGEGRFVWADGSVYEGEFFLGKMTGKGKLFWPDGGWYEGELRSGYRHGRGLYVCTPTFYAGYWKCGRRHGVGAMFYNHFDTDKNYYNGEWMGDKKHGTGLRSYPSGAMYSGQWRAGERHGLGTMVWTNRDVYSGNFHRGKMHGYGEYTWETFFNRQLVVPEENCYYGNWVNNVRHGNGTMETTTGVIVKGSWKNNKKHGSAEVICNNGHFLYDDNLFETDNICLAERNVEDDSLINASIRSPYKLPVSAASHEINLEYYVNRLVEYIDDRRALGKPFSVTPTDSPVKIDTKRTFSFNRSFEPENNKLDLKVEEICIRNVLMQFLSTLRVTYTTYAQVCCDVKPSFSTILMRFMWWQLLRDCNLHSRGFSLAHFDTCIANNKACLVQGVHYPFERLLFWQFLHCLVEVSWELYAKKCTGTSSVRGIIASGLHKLITDDLIPNAGRHKGNALFGCRDLLSFDALYWYYRGVGDPHTAREFLKRAAVPQQDEHDKDKDPVYQEHQIRGKNVIGVGGRLTYSGNEKPLFPNSYSKDDPTHPKNLSCLSSIGLSTILECILQICPSISRGELLVNMDYKIVFLEFYEILLLCACKKAKDILILKRKNKEEVEEPETAPPESNTVEDPPPQPEESLPPPDKSSKRKKSTVSKKSKKSKGKA